MKRLLFACCLFLTVFPAIGQNDPSIRQQNISVCKFQSFGNTNAYLTCMADRERAQEVEANRSYMAELTARGNGSPCWKLNLEKDEYGNCIKGLNVDDLKAEFERMQSGCEAQYSFCDLRRIVEGEQNKRQAIIREEKAAKREAEQNAELDRVHKEIASEAAASEAIETKKKLTCGDSYHKIRVGMEFATVKQCYGDFRLVSEINRADGIVSIYIARTGTRVYVMNGKVTAWYSS